MPSGPQRRNEVRRRRLLALCCALSLNALYVDAATVPLAGPAALTHNYNTVVARDLKWNSGRTKNAVLARQIIGEGSESAGSTGAAVSTSVVDGNSGTGADSTSPSTGVPNSGSSLTATAIASVVATTTVTRTASATAAVSTSTSVPVGYQLPQAFDTTLGTNFTGTACPSFFETFLADPVFISCAPLSLLLTTSNAFFTAQRSPYSLLPFVLDASCSVDNATCSALMSQLVVNIKRPNACGPDFNKGNPLVTEAVQGFQNYDLMRRAGCQRNNVTQQYCLAEACASPDPDELYFYYLPTGSSLPSGTQPACSTCPNQLLTLYSSYAQNSTLTLSKVYAAARSISNQVCGPNFAPAALSSTSGSTSLAATSLSLLVLTVAVLYLA